MIQAVYNCHWNDTRECSVIHLHCSDAKAAQRREGKAYPRNDNEENLIRRSGTCQGGVSTKVDIIPQDHIVQTSL